MSIQVTENKVRLTGIVQALEAMAGEDDMASVQINSDGNCILRRGVLHTDHYSVEQFAKVMADAVDKKLNE